MPDFPALMALGCRVPGVILAWLRALASATTLGGTWDQVGSFLFARMLQPIATSSPTEPSGFCLA